MLTIAELIQRFPAAGELVWIGFRPARNAAMISVSEAMVDSARGLIGDRYGGAGKRQVTLMQWEHLAVLESFLGRPVRPEMLRRNLVLKGVNLLALKNRTFRIGDAVFQATGQCHPCSKMEVALGRGAYNAMRGHGGLTARILDGGMLSLGDGVTVLPDKAISSRYRR